MSKLASQLSAGIKSNPLIVSSLVIGIVGLASIAGVLAWSNNTPAHTTSISQKHSAPAQSKKASDQNAGSKQQPAAQTNQSATATENLGYNGPYLGGSSTVRAQPTAAPVNVQVASATTQPASNVSSTGSTDNVGTVNNGPATPTPTPTPVPSATNFDKPRISINFDDGWKSIHDNGLPLLQKHGLTSTQYIIDSATIGATSQGWTGYMTNQGIKDFATAGHEIAWHTVNHCDLTNLTGCPSTTIAQEVTPTAPFLNLLMNVNVTMTKNFAAPYGTYNEASIAAVKNAGYTSYRSTDDGYNTKATFDPYHIVVKNVCGAVGVDACNGIATTPAVVQTWIDQAKIDNSWLVIVYHEVGDFSRAQATADGTVNSCDADPADTTFVADSCVIENTYATTAVNLDQELSLIKSSGISVETMAQALKEIRAQVPAAQQ